MPVPSVAIVGRPNVGKSSLLNAVVGRRVSIVEPSAGVTRDRVSAFMEWQGREFELVDTGGLGLVDSALLKQHVTAQIQVAMEEAHLVVFVVDAKAGLTPMDFEVGSRIRRLGKPVLLCVNKVEARADEFQAVEGHRFGFGEPFLVSAKEGYGISDLLDGILAALPPQVEEDRGETGLKIAIVGKRNAGKSTLVNLLAGEERVIVSEMPGTTRDAVDVRFEREGRRWTAIDTAGIRRKTRVQDAIEFFSLARSERSVRRADVVFLMFDMTQPISQVDKKLAAFALQNFKPCVLLGNKVDLAEKEGRDASDWEAYLRQELPGLSFTPISFISAKEGLNIEGTLALAEDLHAQAGTRAPTAELNAVLQKARQSQAPGSKGHRARLFYATQVAAHPPTILVFVNDPCWFTGQYDRYLQARLREAFAWKEVPIRLSYRRRAKVDLPPE